ncbi:MAG: single-stranded-DNA-specific exonuclease RecJ [Microscillaceae bacterium]|nr:single-stranded-DNA-specific exonuclease RecJ [Microscillaceae bacterium]
MKKRWIYREIPTMEKIRHLADSIGVTEALATLLVQRNIHSFEEAKSFFRPSLDELPDPFLMKDMTKAVARLQQCVEEQEKLLIYGDYDVDGTTAVALVYDFLKDFHSELDFYLPDRHREGYGVSNAAIEWAHEQGFQLIISLDCGIKAVEPVRLARSLGIDFIICDHHLAGEELPPATAILNPKQEDCFYPFQELTGCGIGFKLIEAFCIASSLDSNLALAHLDLVAVSIALDMVPMVGENRTLAYYGLQKLAQQPRPGLKALMEIAGLARKTDLSISDLVFKLGPRINAVGRLKHARQAVELLIAQDERQTEEAARELNQLNNTRKHLDHTCTEEALEMIKTKYQSGCTTVLFKPDWHQGVIGIVASRCIEQYHRPTIILTQSEEEDILVGSGRSIPGFDLYEALHLCADLLIRYGGHRQAAGLSLKKENLDVFRNTFEKIVAQNIQQEHLVAPLDIDLCIHLEEITPKFYRIIRQMAPFGPQNMRPVFVSKELICTQVKLLKEQHLRFYVSQKDSSVSFPVIGFQMAAYYPALIQAKSLNLCYIIEENEYQGNSTLQLQARAIQII